MDILYLFAGLIVLLLFAQIIVLRMKLRAQERQFAEYKSSVVMVPVPKKKASPWIAVFAISTLILSVAVFVMAVR